MTIHTPGPWYWHEDSAGRVSLRTPNRGNLIVMDFARKGMNDAAPRLAVWDGMKSGAPRERHGGILEPFNAEHPDARLIAAAPDLLAACKAWEDYFDRLDAESDPTDAMVIVRRQFHAKRLDATRAAIAKAEGGQA